MGAKYISRDSDTVQFDVTTWDGSRYTTARHAAPRVQYMPRVHIVGPTATMHKSFTGFSKLAEKFSWRSRPAQAATGPTAGGDRAQ
jgi:hypothetical protein